MQFEMPFGTSRITVYSKEDKDDNVVYRDLDVIMVSAKRLTPSLISERQEK